MIAEYFYIIHMPFIVAWNSNWLAGIDFVMRLFVTVYQGAVSGTDFMYRKKTT